MLPDNGIIRTTCPRDCYDACGIAVVRRKGEVAKVLGDPEHPVSRGVLCGKCAIAYNGAWRDPTLRLTTPLRRTGPKGSAQFEPMGWDAALALVADRLAAIAAHDARQILHTHYTGTVGLLAGWFPIRLFNRLGATEVDPDTVCNKAGHATLEMMFGNSLEGFDPRTARDTHCVLIWGANPSHSAPHQNARWLRGARGQGAKLVVVDPIRHATARDADIHLQIAPGSDAVLAFAMLHVLHAEDRLDRSFIQAHVATDARLWESISQTSPATAAAACGVRSEDIVGAARAYGHGPSLLWLGQGVQRQPRGGNIVRAVASLVALTGNLAKPGAGLLYMNGPGMRGIDMGTMIRADLASAGTTSVSHMDLAAMLEDPKRTRAFVNWNNNPAASSPEQRRLRRALAREDLFHVAVELFHTDTTAFADIVLPAASFLECDDLVVPYFDLTLSAQVKAAEPPGDALPNTEIFRRLARALGFTEPELFESDAELIAGLLAQTNYPGDFASLSEAGTVELFSSPRLQFESLVFPTPSGRIEIASQRAVQLGMPLTPQPEADASPASGRLRVLSPASAWLMNSSYGNDQTLADRLGDASVVLHPADAKAHGVRESDRVVLSNENGELTLQVLISDEAQPGMAIVYKGRWPMTSPGMANVNVLVPGRKADIAESTSVHGTEVSLRLADVQQ